MTRIRRVLFASDLSETSSKAVATAVALAKLSGGKLTMLHVIATVPRVVPQQFIDTATWDQIDAQNRRGGERQFAKLVAKLKKAYPNVKGLIVEGEPVREIVRAARSTRADLLVVGTHGRHGLTKLLLGSVAARVVASAPCPVVTVRRG